MFIYSSIVTVELIRRFVPTYISMPSSIFVFKKLKCSSKSCCDHVWKVKFHLYIFIREIGIGRKTSKFDATVFSFIFLFGSLRFVNSPHKMLCLIGEYSKATTSYVNFYFFCGCAHIWIHEYDKRNLSLVKCEKQERIDNFANATKRERENHVIKCCSIWSAILLPSCLDITESKGYEVAKWNFYKIMISAIEKNYGSNHHIASSS